MKSIRFLLISLVLCMGLPAIAEDVKNPTPEKPVAALVEKSKIDYKDALMSFVMKKAEKYSEAGEVTVEKGVDLAMKEAPILVEEYIKWRAFYHAMRFLIPLSIALGWIYFMMKFIKLANTKGWENEYRNEPSGYGCLGGVSIFIQLVLFIVTLCHTDHLFLFVQTMIAPRVYILEQAIQLLK